MNKSCDQTSEINNRKYNWIRWLLLLPATVVFTFLSLMPLHWILYSTLTGSGLIIPYPEFPERVFSPLLMGLMFVLIPYKIAPKGKYWCSVIFLLIWVIMRVVGLYLALSNPYYFDSFALSIKYWGIPNIMGFSGALIGILIVRKQIKKERGQTKKLNGIQSNEDTGRLPTLTSDVKKEEEEEEK